MSNATLTPEQLEGLENVMQQTIDITIKHMGLKKSCLSCQQFNESDELCKLAGQRPPARTIVTGCEAYVETEPF